MYLFVYGAVSNVGNVGFCNRLMYRIKTSVTLWSNI